jgi:hypothetical protein
MTLTVVASVLLAGFSMLMVDTLTEGAFLTISQRPKVLLIPFMTGLTL